MWYSIYVLDRLLSLQLGRPPAVHDGDFSVNHPSRLEDAVFSDQTDTPDQGDPDRPMVGDYFLAMIHFSEIIGRVLRSLYSPCKTTSAEVILSTIEHLNQELLQWKTTLPRVLRFDLAHTFERSMTFKRQASRIPSPLLPSDVSSETCWQ